MRTAGIAAACLLAWTAVAGAGESAPDLGLPMPLPGPTLHRVGPPPPERIYPAEPVQLQRSRTDFGRPPRGRTCFSQAETRDKVVAQRLADPVRAMRLGRREGEALSAKLCRWKADELVYEVHVLRPDGRVLRVFVNAQNGEPLSGQTGPERDPEHH
jgi:hypothetical protein